MICARLWYNFSMITAVHYISMAATLAVVSLAGIWSARFVKSTADFSVGGRQMGALLIASSLAGSFIGGTSTVGTAQLAFRQGISAAWFTLGGGLACLVMAAFLAGRLKERSVDTVPQFLAGAYTDAVRPWVALYTSLGMFIQIAAQCLSAVPIISSLLPVSPQQAAVFFTFILTTYVVFGGFWGSSITGVLKLALLCAVLSLAGLLSFKLAGGYRGLAQAALEPGWFSLWSQSPQAELAKGFSVIVGFISTQTYLQPVFAAKDRAAAQNGLLWAGVLMPLLGLACVSVGMWMRAAHPDINPASALPVFIVSYLKPWVGGVALATLLVSLFLSGAALCLGTGTILAQDVYGRLRPQASDREMLLVSRSMVLLVGAASLAFVLINMHTMILKWAFLSMTLRGVTVFFPLMGAVFFPGRLSPRAGLAAVTVPPLVSLLWAFGVPGAVDPLYIGLLLSLLTLFIFSLPNPLRKT